jgi:hypothetical protein
MEINCQFDSILQTRQLNIDQRDCRLPGMQMLRGFDRRTCNSYNLNSSSLQSCFDVCGHQKVILHNEDAIALKHVGIFGCHLGACHSRRPRWPPRIVPRTWAAGSDKGLLAAAICFGPFQNASSRVMSYPPRASRIPRGRLSACQGLLDSGCLLWSPLLLGDVHAGTVEGGSPATRPPTEALARSGSIGSVRSPHRTIGGG